MKKLKDYEIEFIEYTGLSMQADGLPKIAGRLFGLLVLANEPLSFSQISETLQVSKGSVSTNTRLLEGLGILERVSLLGERQVHFKLPDNPYSSLMEGYAGRMNHYHKLLSKSIKKAPKGSLSRKRLENHKKFYSLALTNNEVLIDKLKKVH